MSLILLIRFSSFSELTLFGKESEFSRQPLRHDGDGGKNTDQIFVGAGSLNSFVHAVTSVPRTCRFPVLTTHWKSGRCLAEKERKLFYIKKRGCFAAAPFLLGKISGWVLMPFAK
jgi:hypothetical protein|nr:MAG TPA: hypothetical protein [Caudoviricetes sp.]